ncbi:MAG: response regulator [Thermoleophilia bacterium]|nr:response regulator [Thermoleophilia bacterium]
MTSTAARILVIDDDDAARRMMRRALERRGYTVLDADSGTAGIACITADRPDLVLLDLRMPGTMSGLDVAAAAKGDPAVRDIPIIIVSASVHTDARELVLQTGCEDFAEKPVDFDYLDERIKLQLNR